MTREEAAVIARAARAAKVGPMEGRFWSKVDRRGGDECWLWKAAMRRPEEGYGAFWLNGRHQPASRVSWMITNGPIPEGMKALHKCDNPSCVNPSHLFLGTNDDNMADRSAKGRQVRGAKQKNAVLNDDLVRELRKLAAEVGISEAGRRLGIKLCTAQDACTRSWKHVT